MKSLVLISLTALASSSLAAETETMTILGAKSSIGEDLGPSTIVISERDIEKANATSVLDYLKTVPGIYVQRTGSFGGQAGVFVRGAKQDQLIVAIDGIPVSDPTLTGGGFNLSHLSVADVASIEIYKGSQSILFGSDGLGGVINVVTKKNRSESVAYVEGGSQEHLRAGVSNSGKLGSFQYRINGEQWSVDGESDASVEDGNTEKDGYLRQSLSGIASYNTGTWYTTLNAQLSKSEKDLDGFGDAGFLIDDSNYVAKTDRQSLALSLGRRLFDLDWRLDLSQTRTDREYVDDVDVNHSWESSSEYDGVLNQASLLVSGDFLDSGEYTIGLQQKSEEAETETNFGGFEEDDGSQGVFVLVEQDFETGVFYKVSLRQDDYQRSGVEETGSIQLGYQLGAGQL